MRNWIRENKKLLIVILVLLILFGCVGCTDNSPKQTEESFVKGITVKPIQVETIQVETIEVEEVLTETILYEDASTYWDWLQNG